LEGANALEEELIKRMYRLLFWVRKRFAGDEAAQDNKYGHDADQKPGKKIGEDVENVGEDVEKVGENDKKDHPYNREGKALEYKFQHGHRSLTVFSV
jgi:hypothetical protein